MPPQQPPSSSVGPSTSLFEGITAHFPSQALTDIEKARLNEAKTKIREYGGEITDVASTATHIITSDIHFTGYDDLVDDLHVVTYKWLEMSIRKDSLQNPRYHSPDPRKFFSGFVVTCSELPSGDKQAILGGVLAMGGEPTESLTRFTTHIVCLNLDSEKCQKALSRPAFGIKMVLPHWYVTIIFPHKLITRFDDCLRLGRKIPEDPYLHPNPSFLNGDTDPPVSPELKISHKVVNDAKRPPARTNTQILATRCLYLAKDLGIGSRLRSVLEEIIIEAGGTITNDLKKADVYVGMTREGSDFQFACRRRLILGNLTWFYHMFSTEKWSNPLDHLLHFPVPNGIDGMQNAIISISRYEGEARLYIERLILATGAKFTRTLSPENTHLIVASLHGEKAEKAKEWGVDVVSHLWLEETYAKNKIQPLSNPRYSTFPSRTHLAEVVGKTPFDQEFLDNLYGYDEVDDENEDDDEKMADEEVESKVAAIKPISADGKENIHLDSEGEEPFEKAAAARLPKSSAGRPKKLISKIASSESTPKKPSFAQHHLDTNASSPKPTGPLTPKSISALQTPNVNSKSPFDPPTSFRRSAAVKAENKLHNEIMPDLLAYQKEKNRKTFSPDVFYKDSTAKSSTKRKRSDDKENQTDSPIAKAKKHAVRLLVTGYFDQWTEEKERSLKRLGVHFVTKADECTHLAAPIISRTEKFLTAIPFAPIIVNTLWLEACIHADKLLDTKSYLLADTASEKKWRFKLNSTLDKAKANEGKLLQNYRIYVTPHVRGGFQAMSNIAASNGGNAIEFTATRKKKESSESKEDKAKKVFISCEEDKKLWNKYLDGEGAGENTVYSAEWLLSAVLRQKVTFEASFQLN